jgi:hypothetical protein
MAKMPLTIINDKRKSISINSGLNLQGSHEKKHDQYCRKFSIGTIPSSSVLTIVPLFPSYQLHFNPAISKSDVAAVNYRHLNHPAQAS